MSPEYKIVNADEALVNLFVNNFINGARHFRYFQKRPISIIKQHLLTSAIINETGTPVAYGHLEKESGILWLGIAVADNELKKGLGKSMLSHLINFARNSNEKLVSLSVDNDNLVAQHLYTQSGFVKQHELATHSIFELSLS